MTNLLRPLFLAALLTLGMTAASFGLPGPGDDDSDESACGRDSRHVADEAPPEGALSSALARNWDTWAAGRHVLDAKAIASLFADASIHGENAAALATLDFALRRSDASGADTSALTRAEALAALRDADTLRFYADRVRLLRKLPRALFTPGAPSPKFLRLGPGGDDALFAVMDGLAESRPNVLKHALCELPDGRFRVTLPGAEPLTIAAPTDAELARNDDAVTLSGGRWAPALEKAWAALLARQAHELPVGESPKQPQLSDVLRLWTGNPVLGLRLPGSGQATDDDALRSALARMTARRSLALTRTATKTPSSPAGLAYAVIDYDAMTDMLTLRDPRGGDFLPAGTEEPQSGHARRDGVFHLSLADFERLFDAIAVEQNDQPR